MTFIDGRVLPTVWLAIAVVNRVVACFQPQRADSSQNTILPDSCTAAAGECIAEMAEQKKERDVLTDLLDLHRDFLCFRVFPQILIKIHRRRMGAWETPTKLQ